MWTLGKEYNGKVVWQWSVNEQPLKHKRGICCNCWKEVG